MPVTFQGTPGLTFGKAEDKMGWNAQPTCAVMMDNVRVPVVNLLGEEGKGFKVAMNACNCLRPFEDCTAHYAVHALMPASIGLH